MFRRVRVADYQRFPQVYDAGTPAREAGGLHNEQNVPQSENPNDILIMSTVDDVQQARAYGQSDEVRARQQASAGTEQLLSGVMLRPS